MHDSFNLVLTVSHACNLRCDYCYTGTKFGRSMPFEIGSTAINRALASLAAGGVLELGFFGGEPLLEATLIRRLSEHARICAVKQDKAVRFALTTNGTLADGDAWEILTDPAFDIAISHDGLPEVHDRHRRSGDGLGSAATAERTIRKLVAAGKPVRAIMVVRPDTVGSLPDGIRYLRALGITSVEPSLDLWTHWTADDIRRLQATVARCADVWRTALPDFGISWFDEKLSRLSRVPLLETSRCGFGVGQIAVAASGNLYPCERLIGEDKAGNSMRLPGHALDGADFLAMPASPTRPAPECLPCAMQDVCGTTCRCSNYVRTGNVAEPDALLCLLEQACVRETVRVFTGPRVSPVHNVVTEIGGCHV